MSREQRFLANKAAECAHEQRYLAYKLLKQNKIKYFKKLNVLWTAWHVTILYKKVIEDL